MRGSAATFALGLRDALRTLAPALVAGAVLGIACLLVSPLVVLAVVAGLFVAAVIVQRPEFGLLGMVVITTGLIDAERLPLLGVGPISLHATDILLVLMLGVLLVRALVDRSFRIVTTPLDVPLIAFYGAIVLSAVQAIARYGVDAHNVLRQLRPLTYYLVFFVVTNLVREKRQLRLLLIGLMGIAVATSLALVVEVIYPQVGLVDAREVTLTTAGREYSGIVRTYIQADRLIYPMLLVSTCLLLMGASRLPSVLMVVQTVALAIGIFLSFQRNYWITMAMMGVLLLLIISWSQRLRALKWAIIGLVVLTLVVAIPGTGLDATLTKYTTAAWDRVVWGMQPSTLAQDSSTQMRLLEMQYAFRTIVQHPLVGIGLYNIYRPPIPDDPYFRPDEPSLGLRWYSHNAYLWIWVMAGLVGLVPFLWLYGAFLWRGFTRWRRLVNPRWRAVVLGLTLAILGQMITNIVAPNLIQSWSLVVFAIILGINEVVFRLEGTGTVSNKPTASGPEL